MCIAFVGIYLNNVVTDNTDCILVLIVVGNSDHQHKVLFLICNDQCHMMVVLSLFLVDVLVGELINSCHCHMVLIDSYDKAVLVLFF